MSEHFKKVSRPPHWPEALTTALTTGPWTASMTAFAAAALHSPQISLPREVCDPSCGSTSPGGSLLDRHPTSVCRRRRARPA
jgi:hypothetical protein